MGDMTSQEAKLWILYYITHRIPCSPERFLELMRIAGYTTYKDDPFEVDFDPIKL